MSWEELNQHSTQVSLPPTFSHWVFPLLPFVPALALFYCCLSKGLALNKGLGGMPDKNNTECTEQSCWWEDSATCPVSSMTGKAVCTRGKPQILNSDQGSNFPSTLSEWCPPPGINVLTCDIGLTDLIINGPQCLLTKSTASLQPLKVCAPDSWSPL